MATRTHPELATAPQHREVESPCVADGHRPGERPEACERCRRIRLMQRRAEAGLDLTTGKAPPADLGAADGPVATPDAAGLASLDAALRPLRRRLCREVLAALATGPKTYPEICRATGRSGRKDLSQPLYILGEAGYVVRRRLKGGEGRGTVYRLDRGRVRRLARHLAALGGPPGRETLEARLVEDRLAVRVELEARVLEAFARAGPGWIRPQRLGPIARQTGISAVYRRLGRRGLLEHNGRRARGSRWRLTPAGRRAVAALAASKRR